MSDVKFMINPKYFPMILFATQHECFRKIPLKVLNFVFVPKTTDFLITYKYQVDNTNAMMYPIIYKHNQYLFHTFAKI